MGENAAAAKALGAGAARASKRIIVSYVADWLMIVLLVVLGGIFNKVITSTNKRPFSLQDPSITYPYEDDTVSVAVLLIIAIVAPLVITAVVSLVVVPGPTASKTTPKALIWRRKLWELNTAWLGLGLSLASAFMITEGLKDLGGKPRPYALSKCRPDLNAVEQYRVGGLGASLDTTFGVPIRVSAGICQETDPGTLREIFASWPSGHSSFSFAGLLYLTLFLCAKFSVGIPYTVPNQQALRINTYDYDNSLRQPASIRDSSSENTRHEGAPNSTTAPPRNTAAAPPIYLLILAVFVPIGTAIFVCVSRWFDFHHHGIDIFSGAILGTFCAYFSFRYYHMPIRRGSGWAWGARSRQRAFWTGIGRDGYVGDEGWCAANSKRTDVEMGSIKPKSESAHDVTGAGVHDEPDAQPTGAGRLDVATEGGQIGRH